MRRRGTTSACPGLTGKASAMANAVALLASHRSGGMASKGDIDMPVP
jgi:hypothetical protein